MSKHNVALFTKKHNDALNHPYKKNQYIAKAKFYQQRLTFLKCTRFVAIDQGVHMPYVVAKLLTNAFFSKLSWF